MAGQAVETTKRMLFKEIPILREKFLERSAKPPRLDDRLQTVGGPHKSPDDPHNQDRALDIILFSNSYFESAIAQEIIKVFLNLREQMKWLAVIYDQTKWDKNGIPTPRLHTTYLEEKKRNPPKDGKLQDKVSYEHHTHIHIEWAMENKNATGFEAELEKGLHKILLGRKSFYLYFGGGNSDLIRKQYEACAAKIDAKGGKIADGIDIHTDFVVQIGDEIPRKKGDPIETNLEKARMFNVPIIMESELDSKL